MNYTDTKKNSIQTKVCQEGVFSRVKTEGVDPLFNDGSYVQYSDLQGTLELKDTTVPHFFVGGKKIQQLLRPRHKYYADKWGSIERLSAYEDEDEGKRLVYPKVRAVHRENPYRKMQLRSQTTARTTKAILRLIENAKLKDFRVNDLVSAFPKECSIYLAGKGKRGRDYAWRIEDRLWAELRELGLAGEGIARSVNLHTWQTKFPLEPHFHFHGLIPNYECKIIADERETEVGSTGTASGDWSDEFTEYYNRKHHTGDKLEGEAVSLSVREPQIVEWTKSHWDTGKGGKGGQWSNRELDIVKAVWLKLLLDFTKKHRIEVKLWSPKLRRFASRRGIEGLAWLITFLRVKCGGFGLVNLHSEYIRVPQAKTLFMHKVNYKARHWSEDYAKYSNEHLDCDNPPDWLMHYDNRTRVFGWWGNIKKLSPEVKTGDKEKLSPYTTKLLKPVAVGVNAYVGEDGFKRLLTNAGERLFWVEFIKGRPVEGEYTPKEVDWLRSVCMFEDSGYYGVLQHKTPEPVDLQGTLELRVDNYGYGTKHEFRIKGGSTR